MSLSRFAAEIIACHTILTFLAALAVALRILAIRISKHKYKSHDYLSFLSLGSLLGFVTLIDYAAAHGGLGLHASQIQSSEQLELGLKLVYIAGYFYITTTTANRLSILILYMGIFRRRPFLVFAKILGAVLIAGWLEAIPTLLLICQPISLNWDAGVLGFCGKTSMVQIVSAVINLIADLIMVVLPMPILWGLQMSKGKKLTISIVVGLGIVIAGVDLGRLIQYSAISKQSDFTYSEGQVFNLLAIECALGLIVVCIPTLPPILPSRRASRAKKRVIHNKAYSTLSNGTPSERSKAAESSHHPGARWIEDRGDIELYAKDFHLTNENLAQVQSPDHQGIKPEDGTEAKRAIHV